MPSAMALFQKSWKLSSFRESFRRSRTTPGRTHSFFTERAAVFNTSISLPENITYCLAFQNNCVGVCDRGTGNINLNRDHIKLITVLLLWDVVSVDDGRGAQQLLEFLGFECLWETLQRHQQQLHLLWSAEGWGQVGFQSAQQDLLKNPPLGSDRQDHTGF